LALTVTILIGLPGSGKTTYLQSGLANLPLERCFDDFHGNSLDGTGTFTKSRHYVRLKEYLQSGIDCLISDIEYCRSDRLLDAERGLAELFHELGVTINIVKAYFENNPNACRHNIVHRYWCNPRRQYIEELKKVDELSIAYDCPSAGAIPIGTCCGNCCRPPSNSAQSQ